MSGSANQVSVETHILATSCNDSIFTVSEMHRPHEAMKHITFRQWVGGLTAALTIPVSVYLGVVYD